MTKKTIGILQWKLGDNSLGITSTYLEYFSEFGNIRPIMNADDMEKVSKEIDLLVLTGGADLDPACYGEVPRFTTSNVDVHKQYFYDHHLDTFIKNGTPIFGICLGIQQLGVKFGQKLTQNLIWHAQSKDRWQKGHAVYPIPLEDLPKTNNVAYFLSSLKGIKSKGFEVNSHHHQGLELKKWNKDSDIFPILVSDDLDVVEGIIHKTLPIIGVQYHPEEWYDDFSKKAVTLLLNYKTNFNPVVQEKMDKAIA